MNDGRRKAAEKLDNLINAIVEDILDAPDSEIIAEANENYDDVDAVVSRVRSIISGAIAKSGKARMTAARQAYQTVASGVSGRHLKLLSFQEKAALIERVAKSKGGSEQQLTLAARNLERISEDDLDAKLEALLVLGLIDDKGNIK